MSKKEKSKTRLTHFDPDVFFAKVDTKKLSAQYDEHTKEIEGGADPLGVLTSELWDAQGAGHTFGASRFELTYRLVWLFQRACDVKRMRRSWKPILEKWVALLEETDERLNVLDLAIAGMEKRNNLDSCDARVLYDFVFASREQLNSLRDDIETKANDAKMLY